MHILLVSLTGFLVSVSFWSVLPLARTAAGLKSGLHVYNVGADDVIFTDDLVFESLARSDLDCTRQCSSRNGCLASTFIRGSTATSPGTCRGHPSVVLTSSGAQVTSRNETKTYRWAGASAWVDKPCTADSDCPAEKLSQCFKGRCLCATGLFYSTSQDTCLESCVLSNVGTGFLKYRDVFVSASSVLLYMNTATGPNLCLSACVNNTQCCYVGVVANQVCYFQAESVASGNTTRWLSATYADSYYRTCT